MGFLDPDVRIVTSMHILTAAGTRPPTICSSKAWIEQEQEQEQE
jgi:hypothetical protein